MRAPWCREVPVPAVRSGGPDPVNEPPLLSATGICKSFRRKAKPVLRDAELEIGRASCREKV